MPLPYYDRLSKRDQAIYRQSASIGDVPLPDAPACRPLVEALRQALEAGERAPVERAAQRLVARIAHQLQTEPVVVRVLARRPRSASAELHGLYVREEGSPSLIQVWMRTAARKQVASFRTFLRTLLHELCHHLDYAHFALADSFHTEGFFRRESSLMRQLVPKGRTERHVGTNDPPALAASQAAPSAAPPVRRPRRRRGATKQMDLPF